ncbi:MAG: translation initiation factor IF-2 [Arenicellales bacterium WSBS_2016_MAG_OTU3]
MTEVTVKTFANQTGLVPDTLLKLLNNAGVSGKAVDDALSDAERKVLLQFMRDLKSKGKVALAEKAAEEEPKRARISLKKSSNEIRQTSRTGAARTIHVEVKKKRTFKKRSELEDERTKESREQAEIFKAEQETRDAAATAEVETVSQSEVQKNETAQLEAERIAAEQAEAERLETERLEAERIAAEAAEAAAVKAAEAAAKAEEAAAKQPETEAALEAVDLVEPQAAAEPQAPSKPKFIPGSAAPSIVSRKPRKTKAEIAAEKATEKAAEKTTEKTNEKATEAAQKAAAAKPKSGIQRKEALAKDPKDKPGKKGKRSELHVAGAKLSKRRQRPAPTRRPKRVTSAIAEQHGFEKPTAPVIRDVVIPETITVGELAQGMSIKAAEVIKAMMGMGSMVTINQMLDQDTATILVEEMGHRPVTAAAEDPEALLVGREEAPGELQSRPPVVTVMGHVDHGKTSLLDYIRSAKVAAGEAGGITQHIGAYRIATDKGTMTFLDTPGHEAFSAMRARGAQATDIVILVVAGDDGVKPQTIEAIRHARAADVPIVVAINKMDKEGADPERVKQELANHEVIPDSWGGDVLMTQVSAMTGDGVDTLLETVLLQAELLDLKSVTQGRASGSVIEARLDKGRGPVATILVQHGTLKKGDIILAGRESGRVRAMLDDAGKPVTEAGPSTPVEVQGLDAVPVAGDQVLIVGDEKKAREIALFRQGKFKDIKLAKQQKAKLEGMFAQMGEGDAVSLNLLIKADVQGSVEALTDSLEKLSRDDIKVKVVHGMVGGINESDANLATASDAIVVGFNVRADASARKVIETEGVDVRYYSVIYDVVDEVKAAMSGMLKPEIKEQAVGLVEVRDVFRTPKLGSIAGCYVTEGQVRRNLPVRVLRDNVVIFDGKIDSLRRFKDDVSEVKTGFECGIGVMNYNDIKVGDQIEVYETIEFARII